MCFHNLSVDFNQFSRISSKNENKFSHIEKNPPNRPTPTAPPHRANPTQWRRHIAPTPPRLRCPCTTPLSDRPLHTPPPTPCPIMGHTQASLCDRPCPGSELRSLTPCPPPSPERGLPQPQRATPAPSPQLISRAPSGFTSVLFCRVVCSLPLVVPTLPSP